MAKAEQIKALIRCHVDGDDARFYAIAMQVALVPFFHRHDPFALSRVSLLVFADVAPSSELPRLEAVLRSDDVESRAYAAEATALAGSLALVPAMLDAWVRARSLADHETIGFALSDILEDRAKMAAFEAERDPPPLPGLVLAEHERLRRELGDQAFVWAGSALDVERLVERFIEQGSGAKGLHRAAASLRGVDRRALSGLLSRLRAAAARDHGDPVRIQPEPAP